MMMVRNTDRAWFSSLVRHRYRLDSQRLFASVKPPVTQKTRDDTASDGCDFAASVASNNHAIR